MRLLFLVLAALLCLIQYPLWLGKGGWFTVWDLQGQVAAQREVNDGLRTRNAALDAEVRDLSDGTEAVEERARGELGMMRDGEAFVQILPPGVAAPQITAPPPPKKPGAAAPPARQAPR
ncbi:Cell division protein DivIC (FtsB), stabilizes FtsL against RasP cleavage [plant metagenome]|uniref:Cell division protein DivIC (FtsB), stabilizes FtsL against RasP cleavage n=1 Tax=plant metagenome TaxID=1297885 RepID=A0A484TAU7_9ZZZZ